MAKPSKEKPKSKPKQTKMAIAKRVTVTNPYTMEAYPKGIPRPVPKKKDSWYKCQLDSGYLTEAMF